MNSRFDFVGHNTFDFGDVNPDNSLPLNNFIFKAEDPKYIWIENTTKKIGEWRATFRSTYISWAITINGLHVANKKYSDENWIKDHAFKISSVRNTEYGVGIIPIAKWESKKVAIAHLKPIPMLCSYGIIDLYSCLEEFVFDFYKIFLLENPSQLMQGGNYRELRKLYQNREENINEWQKAFSERLDIWQRKKLYDGLGKTFRSYCTSSKLEKPSCYTNTDLESWAQCIEAIASLRNCLTHGVNIVPEELAEYSNMPYRMGFNFKEGEELILNLDHFMNIEAFFDSLLTGLNISLFERSGK